MLDGVELQNWFRDVEGRIKSEIHAAEKRMVDRVGCLEDKIFKGNGSPPILTRMALLEDACEKLDSRDRRTGSRAWDTAKIMLAASLAVVLSKLI